MACAANPALEGSPTNPSSTPELVTTEVATLRPSLLSSATPDYGDAAEPSPEPLQIVTPTPFVPKAILELTQPETPTILSYQVLASYPHDTSAFTQGLLWHDDKIYESTGLFGESELRVVNLLTGSATQEYPADPAYFGEGLALVDNRLIWLTWQAETATVHDVNTLEQTGTFTYTGEGWGLCYDGTRLVMSDGSNRLTFRDANTFEVLGSVQVTHSDGTAVERLNELECVGGLVWANVWLTDVIVVANPDTGTVVAEVNMEGLIAPHPSIENGNNVLNGIAYRPDTSTFLITGKRWPTLFEVRFN
ncbi:MAG: glutaminyl-peptide cyclotransferase [Acidimicrobiia bacterium]|nr:glutaminyl-peptide cyclotransferase [Acidimicrobiia bacterium]MYC57948.1 glutaminyl-peptide cyclotransferase [Acidimicrobiia bacterium]MYI30819.1 glutaminyl-peptide cyclotransferase [Acidimicrobiia bacterium]